MFESLRYEGRTADQKSVAICDVPTRLCLSSYGQADDKHAPAGYSDVLRMQLLGYDDVRICLQQTTFFGHVRMSALPFTSKQPDRQGRYQSPKRSRTDLLDLCAYVVADFCEHCIMHLFNKAA